MDSQDGLNYLGRIIACCSMRIVSKTGGVVVCTLSLHAEGNWFKSWQEVHIDLEKGSDSTFGGAYWYLNKGKITHLVVDMDCEQGWSFTFYFDRFILISNLQTRNVSFMPWVAVSISLHAWLIHCFGLCIFPSHPKKQDKIQPLLQSTLRLSIHFECWEVLS